MRHFIYSTSLFQSIKDFSAEYTTILRNCGRKKIESLGARALALKNPRLNWQKWLKEEPHFPIANTAKKVYFKRNGEAAHNRSISGSRVRPSPSKTIIEMITDVKFGSNLTLCLRSTLKTRVSKSATSILARNSVLRALMTMSSISWMNSSGWRHCSSDCCRISWPTFAPSPLTTAVNTALEENPESVFV